MISCGFEYQVVSARICRYYNTFCLRAFFRMRIKWDSVNLNTTSVTVCDMSCQVPTLTEFGPLKPKINFEKQKHLGRVKTPKLQFLRSQREVNPFFVTHFLKVGHYSKYIHIGIATLLAVTPVSSVCSLLFSLVFFILYTFASEHKSLPNKRKRTYLSQICCKFFQ